MRKVILASCLWGYSCAANAEGLTDAQFGKLLVALQGSGSHHWLEMAYWMSQIVLAVVASIAAAFAYRQVGLFEQFELLKYLQDQTNREARRHVIKFLANKKYEEWSDDDERNAQTVCSSYDNLGRVFQGRTRIGRSTRDFFLRVWAPSICRTYDILLPYISARINANGPNYMGGYKWLRQEAEPYRSI
jgi:hypothetical protein